MHGAVENKRDRPASLSTSNLSTDVQPISPQERGTADGAPDAMNEMPASPAQIAMRGGLANLEGDLLGAGSHPAPGEVTPLLGEGTDADGDHIVPQAPEEEHREEERAGGLRDSVGDQHDDQHDDGSDDSIQLSNEESEGDSADESETEADREGIDDSEQEGNTHAAHLAVSPPAVALNRQPNALSRAS